MKVAGGEPRKSIEEGDTRIMTFVNKLRIYFR
jgi:hypothetical protein